MSPLLSVWTPLPRMSLIIQKVFPLSFLPGDRSPRSKRRIHSVVPSLPHPSSLYNLTIVRSGFCVWKKLDSCYPATLLIFFFTLWLVLLHNSSVSLKSSFPSWYLHLPESAWAGWQSLHQNSPSLPLSVFVRWPRPMPGSGEYQSANAIGWETRARDLTYI